MTSKFSAIVEIFAQEKTNSIFESLQTDNKFYSENPTNTKMSLDEKITILIETQELSHLRANLNSTLRLVQTSDDSIESVKI
ncbi:MAG TPA: KEOPS complex subunit Pcc1 [Nitrosopumilaceae archaeon]|nr:KEOPS complex subunit Pcc1 [Nitrosopumilaceae archaeon]